MATLETFKGTTVQVNAALSATPAPLIGDNTVVTITDGAYTLTDLKAIISAVGQNKVILEKAASTPIEGTATELKDMLAGVSSYTGDLTVDSASEVSAADLNTIAKGTTGKVTATLNVATPLTKATVDALADVKATDVITFVPTAVPTAITADAAILVAINKIISKADFTAVATITAAAADVALVKEALAYSTVGEPVVTITGAISAADVNAIAKATDGIVTATIADGTVAATLKAIKDVDGDDVITFKTTDTTVKATELKALKGLVDTLDATSIKTITAAAADVAADVAAAAAAAPTANVTITGSISVANANTIAAATEGVLTATITQGTADELKALNTNTSDILALTVNDASLAAAGTTDLVSLLEKTGGKIKVNSGTVEGSIEDLTSIYVTNKAKFEGLGNETVTIDPASEVSAAQLNAIAAATTGKVTATLSSDTAISAATVAALKDVKTTDTITFNSAIDTLDSVEAFNALLAIKKIITDAKFTAVTTIEADAKDVALVKSVLKDVAPTVAVTITGDISAADAAAIAGDSVLTATIKAGTVKDTLKAIEDVDAADVITFKTTDTSVDAKELVDLDALVTLDASSVKTITSATAGSVAEALAIVEDANVTITGSISVANANTIAAATEGVLTATIDAGTVASLAALTDTNTSNILALTVNDADLDAAALVALLEKTGGKIKVISGTVTGTIEDLTSIYVTNKAKFEGLGNEALTISGGGVSAAQLNAIAAATTGKVIATLSSDTPLNAATVKALKDVNSKDAINFGVDEVKSKEEISALLNLKKILPGADFTAVTTIEADAKDIALVKDVLKHSPNAAVTINGEISAADANIIAKSGTGDLTATIKAGSVAATLKAIKDVKPTDTIKFKTTDKSADASELKALADLVDDFDASSVKTITAKSTTNVVLALAIAEDAAVTITGNVAVGDIQAILDATTGKVTATLEADIADNIATALADNEVNAINVTVNGATATASDLIAIKDSTSGKITVTAKDVSGSFDELKELYITSKGKFTALGDEAVTIDPTSEVSAADANIIAKAVNGKVTATNIEADTAAALVASLKDAKATDALTLKVNGESAKASELNVLDGKTSEDVDVDAGVVISGNIADLTKVFATSSGIKTNNNDVTILGTVSAKDANAIVTKTTGEVTATIAADTAAKLKAALTDSDNVLNLTVNGAKANASDLAGLLDKTDGKITVTAKEISGSLTNIESVLGSENITGLDKVAVKITDTVTSVDLAKLDAILAATSGIVTATVASGAADVLVAALENAKATDALKLEVTGTPTAADLLALDGKTSVVVDVKSASISGTAADVKKLLASKGVSLAKDVNITLDSDTEVSAADLNAIAKATGGKVTATAVAAGTAAALNKALGNATKDDIITLKVSGKTATAADLLALDGKTSKAVNAAEVESITGTVADLKKVFTAAQLVAPTIELADEVAVSVSGTVKASDLKDVLSAADGIVTATVAAGKAADLATNLADDPENALKVTITDTKVDAEHLLALDGATSIAVNAASVKTITGDAADVKKAYEAGSDKGISGLGNEAVDLTDATDANAELVSAINDFTTGLIKLPTVTFTNEVATTFSLSDLGDLNGITGLANINADNGQNDTISISLKDLLAANDSKDDFTFTITSDNDKSDSVIFTDTAGWTKDATGFVADTGGNITFTNNTNDQVITITLDNVVL